MKNHILRCVFNADMRCSHDGLSAMLKKNFDIDTALLERGEYVVCINTAKTIVKVYASGNTIAHHKSLKGQINLKTLTLIPKVFNGRSFSYEDALERVIRKEIRQ